MFPYFLFNCCSTSPIKFLYLVYYTLLYVCQEQHADESHEVKTILTLPDIFKKRFKRPVINKVKNMMLHTFGLGEMLAYLILQSHAAVSCVAKLLYGGHIKGSNLKPKIFPNRFKNT